MCKDTQNCWHGAFFLSLILYSYQIYHALDANAFMNAFLVCTQVNECIPALLPSNAIAMLDGYLFLRWGLFAKLRTNSVNEYYIYSV